MLGRIEFELEIVRALNGLLQFFAELVIRLD